MGVHRVLSRGGARQLENFIPTQKKIYIQGVTDNSFNIVTVHRIGGNKTFSPSNHGSQIPR